MQYTGKRTCNRSIKNILVLFVMFKKQLSFILILVFVTTLFIGCGKTQVEKAQDKIVSIGEQFLDYELTIDEAQEQLESIVIPPTEGAGGTLLDSQKDYLEYLILKARNDSTLFEEIKEKVQDIKKRNYK